MATKSCAWRALGRVVDAFLNSKAEVIMTFFALAYYMPTAFIQNLIIQKLCLSKNYPRDYCLSNAINETLEETMQGEASQLLLYYYLLRQLPAIILALFMGQWSDKYGRKYVTIIAFVGCAISATLYFVNARFIDWPPIFMILSVIPAGLGGGYVTFLLGLIGFIRDIHSLKSVTLHLSIVDGVDCLAAQIGPLIGGQLYVRFGAEGVFSMCVAMLIVGIVFTAIFVKDDKFKKGVDTFVVIKDFFDCRGFISCVTAVFKKRDGHFRAYILCILMSLLISIMTLNGFNEILYLYTRLTIKWDVITLNFYNGLTGGAGAIGSVILLPLMVRVFHWSDATIGLIALVATAAYYYVLVFANKSAIYYGTVFLQAPSTLSYITFRSIITKCISFSEMGKVMAVYAVVQAGSANLGQVVATQIYNHTYRFFPGAYLACAGSLSVICVALYIWIFVDLKKKRIVLEKVGNGNDELSSN